MPTPELNALTAAIRARWREEQDEAVIDELESLMLQVKAWDGAGQPAFLRRLRELGVDVGPYAQPPEQPPPAVLAADLSEVKAQLVGIQNVLQDIQSQHKSFRMTVLAALVMLAALVIVLSGFTLMVELWQARSNAGSVSPSAITFLSSTPYATLTTSTPPFLASVTPSPTPISTLSMPVTPPDIIATVTTTPWEILQTLPIAIEFTPTVWSLPRNGPFYDLPPLHFETTAVTATLALAEDGQLLLDMGASAQPLQLSLVNSNNEYWDGVSGSATLNPISLNGTFTVTTERSFIWLPALGEKLIPAGEYQLQVSVASGEQMMRPIKVDEPMEAVKALVYQGPVLIVSDQLPDRNPRLDLLGRDRKDVFLVIGRATVGTTDYLRVMLADSRMYYWVRPINVFQVADRSSLFVIPNTLPIVP